MSKIVKDKDMLMCINNELSNDFEEFLALYLSQVMSLEKMDVLATDLNKKHGFGLRGDRGRIKSKILDKGAIPRITQEIYYTTNTNGSKIVNLDLTLERFGDKLRRIPIKKGV